MLKLINSLFIAFCLAGCAAKSNVEPQQQSNVETETFVYLTRHAEKVKGEDSDPKLSPEGMSRAQALAERLADIKINQIYTTGYQRTQMTAAATAQAQNIELTISSLSPQLLAAKIIKLHQQQNTLVVGHSNTIPEIIKALGVTQAVTIEHQQYGDLYIVKLNQGNSEAMEITRFGKP